MRLYPSVEPCIVPDRLPDSAAPPLGRPSWKPELPNVLVGQVRLASVMPHLPVRGVSTAKDVELVADSVAKFAVPIYLKWEEVSKIARPGQGGTAALHDDLLAQAKSAGAPDRASARRRGHTSRRPFRLGQSALTRASHSGSMVSGPHSRIGHTTGYCPARTHLGHSTLSIFRRPAMSLSAVAPRRAARTARDHRQLWRYARGRRGSLHAPGSERRPADLHANHPGRAIHCNRRERGQVMIQQAPATAQSARAPA